MEYSRVTIETSGGRLISIINGADPGDVDYYIEYHDIARNRELLNSMTGRKVTKSDADKLVLLGLLKPLT